MISDTHLHTRLSSDGAQYEQNSVFGYAKQAENRNIKYIAITEHRDIRTGAVGLINADLEECQRQVKLTQRILKEERSTTEVLCGVELGHGHTHSCEASDILSANEYDFVLGSIHLLKDGFDFYSEDYKRYSDQQMRAFFAKYLEELYILADTADFDSLAHCTYPLRYYARSGRLLDLCNNPAKYAPEYVDIFKKLIKRGKALEINTSGVKKSELTLPSPDLLKLYRDLGGKYVTTGSDSHDKIYVGSGIDVAEDMLKELGFEGVTVFIKRKPIVIKL